MKVFYIVFIFLFISCNSITKEVGDINDSTAEELKQFPWTEEEMLHRKLYGELLEFALYDSTKIHFVNEVLCDTLLKNNNLSFSRIETRKGDSTYYFYYLHECENYSTDYIGVIYLEFKNLDSIWMYNFHNRFSFTSKDFMRILDRIAKKNNSSIEEIMKYRKLNNGFVPHFYFVIMTDSSSFDIGFVEGVRAVNIKIHTVLDSCNIQVFKNEKIKLYPYMEITSRYSYLIGH